MGLVPRFGLSALVVFVCYGNDDHALLSKRSSLMNDRIQMSANHNLTNDQIQIEFDTSDDFGIHRRRRPSPTPLPRKGSKFDAQRKKAMEEKLQRIKDADEKDPLEQQWDRYGLLKDVAVYGALLYMKGAAAMSEENRGVCRKDIQWKEWKIRSSKSPRTGEDCKCGYVGRGQTWYCDSNCQNKCGEDHTFDKISRKCRENCPNGMSVGGTLDLYCQTKSSTKWNCDGWGSTCSENCSYNGAKTIDCGSHYCASDDGACREFVANAALNVGMMLGNFLPAGKVVGKMAGAVKAAKGAGAGAKGQVLAATKEYVKSMKGMMFDNLKANFLMDIKTRGHALPIVYIAEGAAGVEQTVQEFVGLRIGQVLMDALTNEVAVSTEQESNGFDWMNYKDIVTTLDPTGITGVIDSFAKDACTGSSLLQKTASVRDKIAVFDDKLNALKNRDGFGKFATCGMTQDGNKSVVCPACWKKREWFDLLPCADQLDGNCTDTECCEAPEPKTCDTAGGFRFDHRQGYVRKPRASPCTGGEGTCAGQTCTFSDCYRRKRCEIEGPDCSIFMPGKRDGRDFGHSSYRPYEGYYERGYGRASLLQADGPKTESFYQKCRETEKRYITSVYNIDKDCPLSGCTVEDCCRCVSKDVVDKETQTIDNHIGMHPEW